MEGVGWVKVSHLGPVLQSPRAAWVSPAHPPRSRQQAHAGELRRQEGVQHKHHWLGPRVEVEHLGEDGGAGGGKAVSVSI